MSTLRSPILTIHERIHDVVRINVRRLAFWFVVASIALLVAARSHASELVQVTLTPDREQLTVGDPVQLTLSINHPVGYQVIIPQLDRLWGDFEVRSQSQATTMVNGEGTQTTQQMIEVTLFDLGEFQTPELPLTIRDDAGGLSEEVVPSVALTVNPALAEDDTDLRDIKPQASLAVPPPWLWLAGGLVAAVLVVVGGWWGYRTWQGRPFGLAPAVDNRPAWQVAYDELERIQGLGLLERGRFKDYYTLVTDCLRTYLAQPTYGRP